MGEITAAVQARDNPRQATVADLIKRQEPQIARALPKHLTAERFARIVMTEVNRTPRLLECEPVTLLASVMLAAQLGLEPGQPLGLSWIIPYRNNRKGVMEAQFQVGAEGYVELAWRAANIIVEPRIVWEGDEFQTPTHGPGGTSWHHVENGKATRNWSYVYAVARYPDGREYFEGMSYDQVIAHRDRYVRDWDKPGSAWRESEPEMARKTVMKRLAKRLPKSPEIRTALIADETAPSMIVPDIASQIETAETAAPADYDPNRDDPNVSDAELVDDESSVDGSTSEPPPPVDEDTAWQTISEALAEIPTEGSKPELAARVEELSRLMGAVGLAVPARPDGLTERAAKDTFMQAVTEWWEAARRSYSDGPQGNGE